jgi:hypothetical protein
MRMVKAHLERKVGIDRDQVEVANQVVETPATQTAQSQHRRDEPTTRHGVR